MKATYNIPFPDFDYGAMAIACGARVALQQGNRLEVIGTREEIDALSADLDFGPDKIEEYVADLKEENIGSTTWRKPTTTVGDIDPVN
jgi:hypothetical protein